MTHKKGLIVGMAETTKKVMKPLTCNKYKNDIYSKNAKKR